MKSPARTLIVNEFDGAKTKLIATINVHSFNPRNIELDDSFLSTIALVAKHQSKVQAVKVTRLWLNLGLAEAKDITDFICDNLVEKPQRGYVADEETAQWMRDKIKNIEHTCETGTRVG